MSKPKYICHRQEWSSHTSWYIMECHGYAMVRITLYRTRPYTAWLSDLFVLENKRRRGYAADLLDYANSIADQEHINLECTISDMSRLLLRLKGFKELKNGNFAREWQEKK